MIVWYYNNNSVWYYIYIIWLVVWNMNCMNWECHHPNWRTHIFQRVWNHQPVFVCFNIIISLNMSTFLDRTCEIGSWNCRVTSKSYLAPNVISSWSPSWVSSPRVSPYLHRSDTTSLNAPAKEYEVSAAALKLMDSSHAGYILENLSDEARGNGETFDVEFLMNDWFMGKKNTGIPGYPIPC